VENLRYMPDFELPDKWSARERVLLKPFATNIDGLVTVLRNLPPETAGAICSRASRSKGYLLRVLLKEYLLEIIDGEDKNQAHELHEIIFIMHQLGLQNPLASKRARRFFAKNLAQFGDESIAQMTGTWLVFWGISQIAMKFLEDRRIGLAPAEKSTRYVDFSKKVNGKYLYYTDPDIAECGLGGEYREVNDMLFDTNALAVSCLKPWLKGRFSNIDDNAIEKKAFDVARGFLPMSTLGQVAFFGNGQAFDYMINNCAEQKLGELRWIAEASSRELKEEIPSLLLRLDEPKTKDYQKYIASRRDRIVSEIERLNRGERPHPYFADSTKVELAGFDPDGESAVVAGILYPACELRWGALLEYARMMLQEEKRQIIAKYLEGRTARWQKVGRAFENAFVRFEITMNAGAYRDLHRHRMLTQERQLFTVEHGYDVPIEIEEAGLADMVHRAAEKVARLYRKIRDRLGEEHAQYATMLFHRIRFYQYENLREFIWETELRTTPQGHTDYRRIEQEKFKLLRNVYPVIMSFNEEANGYPKLLFVDFKEYDFARRGLEEHMKAKENKILGKLQ